MPGLVGLMKVILWGLCDFKLSFTNRDMSGNVWNRLLGSSMVNIGISSNNIKSHSSKCYMTFCYMTIYSDTLHWWDISLNRDLVTEIYLTTDFDLFTKFREVSIEHLQRMQLANWWRLLLRSPGSVSFGTCIICSYVENSLSKSLMFPDFEYGQSSLRLFDLTASGKRSQ